MGSRGLRAAGRCHSLVSGRKGPRRTSLLSCRNGAKPPLRAAHGSIRGISTTGYPNFLWNKASRSSSNVFAEPIVNCKLKCLVFRSRRNIVQAPADANHRKALLNRPGNNANTQPKNTNSTSHTNAFLGGEPCTLLPVHMKAQRHTPSGHFP